MAVLRFLAPLANLVGAVLLVYGIEVGPFPTVQRGDGYVVDNSQSSIAGVRLGDIAVVRASRPQLVPWAFFSLCFGFGIQVALEASSLLEHRRRP